MASYTPNVNLKKPADGDAYDIADANGNMDAIDTAIESLRESVSQIGTSSTSNLATSTTSVSGGSAWRLVNQISIPESGRNLVLASLRCESQPSDVVAVALQQASNGSMVGSINATVMTYRGTTINKNDTNPVARIVWDGTSLNGATVGLWTQCANAISVRSFMEVITVSA